MQIQALDGNIPLILYDEASKTESLDVNGDGLPDLLITHPQSGHPDPPARVRGCRELCFHLLRGLGSLPHDHLCPAAAGLRPR